MMTALKVLSALALAVLVQLNQQVRPAEGLNPAPPLRPLAPDASSLFAECSNIQSKFPPPKCVSYNTSEHNSMKKGLLSVNSELIIISIRLGFRHGNST